MCAIGLAGSAGALSLSVTPSQGSVDIGEIVVLRVDGEPDLVSDTGAFGRLDYSTSITAPRGVRQDPVGSGWTPGPLRQGVDFAEAFNQVSADTTGTAGAVADVALCAESAGSLSADWVEHSPYDPDGLNYFGLTSAPGAAFTVTSTTFAPAYEGINVDLGSGEGTPPAGYSAATGQGGHWNEVGLGTSSSLRDIDGLTTAVSVTVTTDQSASVSGPATDDHALLGDWVSDCTVPDVWTLSFSGLADGTYEVALYASADPDTATGDMLVEGSAVDALPGGISTLEEGVSYTKRWVDVSDGMIEISGSDLAANSTCSGLAGVQLVLNCLPEPSGAAMLFSGALGVWALGRRRRARG